jgi:hypothetical protein
VTTSTRTDTAPAALRVIATAGHVDHGKSSLIVRLTGIDPDRWAEEKRRGLTIDLGYAWCTLPSGREIGFVDVPGHERFIGNMLAGVGPVPACFSWSRPTVEAQSRAPADRDVLGVRGGDALTARSWMARCSLATEEIANASPTPGLDAPCCRCRRNRRGIMRSRPPSTRLDGVGPPDAARARHTSTGCSRSRGQGPW